MRESLCTSLGKFLQLYRKKVRESTGYYPLQKSDFLETTKGDQYYKFKNGKNGCMRIN